MNNGKTELTIENRLANYEEELDSIIDKIGISYVKDDSSIEALQLSYQQLRNMDQQECCIIAYQLSQYGMYVQSIYNRLNNIKNWASESIDKIVAKESKNYNFGNYIKYEEKRYFIIAENTVAECLFKLWMRSNGKMQELYSISQKIINLSNILLELSKSKRHTGN